LYIYSVLSVSRTYESKGFSDFFGAMAHCSKFGPLLVKHYAMKVHEGVALDGKKRSASRSRRFKPDERDPGTHRTEG